MCLWQQLHKTFRPWQLTTYRAVKYGNLVSYHISGKHISCTAACVQTGEVWHLLVLGGLTHNTQDTLPPGLGWFGLAFEKITTGVCGWAMSDKSAWPAKSPPCWRVPGRRLCLLERPPLHVPSPLRAGSSGAVHSSNKHIQWACFQLSWLWTYGLLFFYTVQPNMRLKHCWVD